MTEKKKVLHIVEAFGGGVFSMLNDLINRLDDEYEIVVAYSKRKQTPQNFKEYFNKDIKFIEVKNFGRSINIKKEFKALKEIKQIIKEEKPNIIHLHSSKAGIIGRLAIKSKKIKMFYNPHGFSFLKKDDSKVKRAIYWGIEKITAFLNPKCTIIACSKGEYDEALKISKNSYLIENGIDLQKLNENIKRLPEHTIDFNNLKICTIGRIGYQKSPKMYNEVAKKLPNIEFTWIGDGELRNELNSENNFITGWQERDKVLEILNDTDIFILTSLWEGLPISLLEAMYMKKICVVTNVVGNRDVINNGKNGFICNNSDEFVSTIKKIQNNKFNIAKIQEITYKDVVEKYSADVMSKKYLNLYKGENNAIL